MELMIPGLLNRPLAVMAWSGVTGVSLHNLRTCEAVDLQLASRPTVVSHPVHVVGFPETLLHGRRLP